MFISLKKTLLASLRKKGIAEKLEALSQKEKAERVVGQLIGKTSIRVLSLRKGTLFLKVPSALAASEVRLKEKQLLRALAGEKIAIQNIRCAP